MQSPQKIIAVKSFVNNQTFVNGNFIYPQVKNYALDWALLARSIQFSNQKENRDIERIILNTNKKHKMIFPNSYLFVKVVFSINIQLMQ